MLTIYVSSCEIWDPKNRVFRTPKPQAITLEHSLVSVSKWESKWKKTFLVDERKTREETIDYIRCMTLTQNVDFYLYYCINREQMAQITSYISSSQTATDFGDKKRRRRNTDIFTSERIYYQMFSLGIPMECQKWHLSRLIALLRIFAEENQPQKKRSRNEIYKEYDQIEAANIAKLKAKGLLK